MQVKKWLLLIIFGISAISGCMTAQYEYDTLILRSEYEQDKWGMMEFELFQRAIVKIHNRKTGNIGTGLIVKVIGDKAYILTVADVVKGESSPIVEFFHDFKERTRVIRADKDYDSRFQNLALIVVEDVDISSKLRYDLDNLLREYPLRVREGDRIPIIGVTTNREFVKKTSARLSHVDRYTLNLYLSNEMTLGSLLIKENRIIGMLTTTKGKDIHAISAYPFRKFIEIGVELSLKLATEVSACGRRPQFERKYVMAIESNVKKRQRYYSTKVVILMETGRFEEALPLAEQIFQSHKKEFGN